MNTHAKKVRGTRSPNDIDRAVGAKLRKLRIDAGLTLHDLGTQIGISHQQLQKYEIGSNRISAGMLPVVAGALGAELMDLYSDADGEAASRKTKADRLREDCESVLRRTKSEEKLESMLRVLKALAIN